MYTCTSGIIFLEVLFKVVEIRAGRIDLLQ